jgi:hypothetical protein
MKRFAGNVHSGPDAGFRGHEERRRRLKARLNRHATVEAMSLGLSVVCGIWGYWYFAGMGPLDGFLNSAMLLSGMGPVGELRTAGAKLFAGIYALYAGIVFVGLSGFVLAPLLHHLLVRFRIEDR